ncbi:MAG: NAD(P)H-dependent glycerol-3-phosphate dehydrogenase [Thiomicrospira sp.]|jgi:glycerol-3-phosphate dehydrogenase (NAD(P)+)|nr:NAD(P)H-dependent glycerol-3-phosphate dehydrogenase [Thiomicrospira sp.]
MNIAVLGAGAWGTALAIHLAKAGHSTRLWAHSATHAEQIDLQRENQRYLPGVSLPPSLVVGHDLMLTLKDVSAVLLVVPSDAFAGVLRQVVTVLNGAPRYLAWATKGFEPIQHRLLHQLVVELLGEHAPMAVLSGPTFADEVARGLPTAMVSSSNNAEQAQFWAQAFHHDNFRIYTQSDMAGVEVGGAYKNIMAIATGVSDGLQLGANARAALISRGMAEMMRFASLYQAQPDTLMGLAGLGDLVLTCTDNLSRNRRFGLRLAQSGKTALEVQQEIGQVVEGVKAVRVVKFIADQQGLDLPIMEQVYQLVEQQITAKEAVQQLLARASKSES